jgi:DNA-binding response OmpR family regulator
MNNEDLVGSSILLVDDTPMNIDVLRKTLEIEKYTIFAAPSGEIALKIAEKNPIDLILLDIMMPNGIDGFETCERLKQLENAANIPILFITAKTETEDMLKGFSLGAVDYITKPFRQEEVLARVQTHLKLKKALQKIKKYSGYLEEVVEERTVDLIKANEQLKSEVRQTRKAEQKLKMYMGNLEKMVEEKTDELTKANEKLKDEIEERKKIENKLKSE